MVKADEAGLLVADLVGEVLGWDKGMQGTKEDEVKRTKEEEAAETISVQTSRLGIATLAQSADFPTILRILSSRSLRVLSANK
jgi:hypothetical protein